MPGDYRQLTGFTVTRYGKTAAIQAAAVTCLRYGVFGPHPVQVILTRDAFGHIACK